VFSPLRGPLVTYLNTAPKETADFFFDRLSQPLFFGLFLHVLGQSEPLRLEIIERKGPSERSHLLVEMACVCCRVSCCSSTTDTAALV
jgi:hypothetical protein